MRLDLKTWLIALIALMMAPVAAHAAGPFDDWAGIFVAGDYRAHSGADSEVFDNGRRDVAKAFFNLGLKPENSIQFSNRPGRYANTPEKPIAAVPQALDSEMYRLTQKVKGGCIFFYTSHGAPEGVVMGDVLIPPRALARMIDRSCGTRPSLVVISACFSGVFVPALAAPNRAVLTAARPDRSSFGCGEEDTYTFFDTCLLQQLPDSTAFDMLAERVRVCVQKREAELGMRPASEPQKAIGADVLTIAFAPVSRDSEYTVKPGDTLAKIATSVYGNAARADEIYQANRTTLPTRQSLKTGQTLKIPPA